MGGFTIQSLGLRIKNKWVTDFLSEILCTFILAIFVYATGAQYMLTYGPGSTSAGRTLGGAVGLTTAVYFGFNASGSCVNPGVTLMFCLLGKIQWRRYPMYICGQLIGAFLAAALTYGLYYDLLCAFDGGTRMVTGPNATAQLFTSFPHPNVSKTTGFVEVVVGVAFLVGSTAAVIDPNNSNPASGLIPFVFTFTLYGILMAFSASTGAPINCNIDFCGRLFAAIIYGTEVFTHRDYWFWVPIVANISGAIVGTCVYQLMIGNHLPEVEEDDYAQNYALDNVTLSNKTDVADEKFSNSSFSVNTNTTTVS